MTKFTLFLLEVLLLSFTTEGAIDFPSAFGGQLATITSWRQDGVVANEQILRLTGLENWSETDVEPQPGGTSVGLPSPIDVHYYLQPTSEDKYAICRNNTLNELTVCDKQETMTPTIITSSLTVTQAKLTYESLSSSNPEVLMNVTSEGPESSKLDAIITFEGATPFSLEQADVLQNAAFSVSGYPVGGSIKLDIIGLTGSDEMKQYGTLTITDYDVKGLGISDTSLEVRWNYQTGKSAYYIQRTIVEGATGYSEASVTCNLDENVNITHCFGYFPNLIGGDYRVTVKKNGNLPEDDLNMVESKAIKVPPPSQNEELSIQHHLAWHRNGMEAQIQVCFSHTRQYAERDFSHYEFVIINNKDGKWFKHKLLTQDTEGELCFFPQTISVDMFHQEEGATLVVTQRAEDGFTVVASGEIQLFLNA